ncbi:MAG: VWA domain-containing protein, partial [Myxococcales bacterium]|nr:VWA domain-containing protein [Myxococcales bacterium]
RVASEVAALLAFSAIRNNDRVGLIVTTDRVERIVPPKKGEKHVMRVVREILGFEPRPHGDAGDVDDHRGEMRLGAATDLRSALEALVRVSRRRSIAFVVSDFYDAGYERALALAAAKHDVVPVVLVDPRDAELPDVGLATFEDLESGESIVLDTRDPRVRAWYASQMKGLATARRTAFHKLGLDAVEIETGGSFVRPLRDLFARRARRIRR